MDQQPQPAQPTPQPSPQPAQQLSPWSQQALGHMVSNLKSNHANPGVLAEQDRAYWAQAIPPKYRAQVPPPLNPDGSLVDGGGA
jgi:hypothetical protein